MMDKVKGDMSFAEALILSEELLGGEQDMDKDDADSLILVDERDVEVNSQFTLEGKNDADEVISFPIRGDGHLKNFVLRSPTDSFSIRVEADDANIVDDDFTTLSSFSAELEDISAYEDTDGKYVVSVSDYDFEEHFNIVIRGDGSTMDIVRAEVVKND
jgi:hypothetical protein